MFEIGAGVGLVGAVGASAAIYASVHVARRSKAARRKADAGFLPDEPIEILPAQVAMLQPLVLEGAVRPFHAEPGPILGAPPTVKVRKVVSTGKPRTVRPVAALAPDPAAPHLSDDQKAELLSLIGTMQWDRALAVVQGHASRGCPLASLAAVAESPTLERVRALPEKDGPLSLGGYRVLAALVPGNAGYAEKVAQKEGAAAGRRDTLLAALTRDEDRFDPGTVWYNHPYNPRFDDVRLPIWLYIGCKANGQPWFRLRTNWLGDMRISVQGIEAIYDGMTETLTSGAYKIDADALGWEWRDEQVDVYQIEVLRSLASAREVRLRYKGDPYFVEVELTAEEQQAIADMIELYDLMRASVPEHEPIAA
ncbi:hypothetical protein FHG66_03545 [Rubellimicrobium rubrum]|uniref:Uncharacterized protein n=1 Tax=Rubellimicrobium rubrum TaxID=2585369 RepID=A0A5C4N394_9RHOB|nr:hypothetical protein [Rubellimicrobium rubrum]TNC51897.1 hypothetical protein FHG66_03545 [Rubellimicrobium rubrum]